MADKAHSAGNPACNSNMPTTRSGESNRDAKTQHLTATLAKIDAVCRRHSISASRFGRDAVNDPALVYGLRRGRALRPSTASAVTAFIAKIDPAIADGATPLPKPSLVIRERNFQLPIEPSYRRHCGMMRQGSAKLLAAILTVQGGR
jgi:hypothetical protein